jgi:threonine dehydratase
MLSKRWQCVRCGADVAMSTWMPFRCPNATDRDRHHALTIVDEPEPVVFADGEHPFVAADEHLAWAACAEANGMDLDARRDLVLATDAAVRAVAGVGFHRTPFARSDVLSDELGFDPDGGVWVKDETGSVAGSQKARFLFSILLHLRAAEELGVLTQRPPLAISSCGNAALAAATLARAVDWPIDVFVPTWMSAGFGDRLDELGARVHRCARHDGDPAGDPAMLRFRNAVAQGAIPFTVQGPENALCLDGGRTLGWEIADAVRSGEPWELDGLFVQVGGGAFASATATAMLGSEIDTPFFPVQTAGCAPLDRALRRAEERGIVDVGWHWPELMTVWDHPESIADGILDDETYDWVDIAHTLRVVGGSSVVASEHAVVAAHDLAHHAGFDASPTGTAGLGGLLSVLEHDPERFDAASTIAVVMSGVTR